MPLARPCPTTTAPHPRAAGFTLVEVMVALFVMAVLATMAWQGVDMVVRSRAAADERVERLLHLQSLVTQWEADLRELVDTASVPAFNFDGAALRLTRRRQEGVQLVVWSVREGLLRRWTSPVLISSEALQDAWIHSQQLLPGEAGQLTMQAGVSGWQLYLFSRQSNSWSNAQSTGDQKVDPGDGGAPVVKAGSRAALPDGVRLALQFSEGSGLAGSLVRDFALVHP